MFNDKIQKDMEVAESKMREALKAFTEAQKQTIELLVSEGHTREWAEDAVAHITEQMWINDFS